MAQQSPLGPTTKVWGSPSNPIAGEQGELRPLLRCSCSLGAAEQARVAVRSAVSQEPQTASGET